jgi:flagellar basal body rod protein FlgG
MAGGTYSALTGMMARLESLDRIASDLANVNTAGYKTERAATTASERERFTALLDSAVDVVNGGTRIDMHSGTIATTGRDLDVAVEGKAFFVIGTPTNQRFTRGGSFTRRPDGLLTTTQGEAVLDDQNRTIKLDAGKIAIDPDGTVRVNDAVAAKLKMVDIDEKDLIRESGARFHAVPGTKPRPAVDSSIVSGALEQSNVTSIDRMVALTEVMRGFEALQKGISTLHEMDGNAIVSLGRR